MSHPYQYVVLRYVPRVDRGECLNVGVVLFARTREFLGLRTALDPDRLRALSPTTDPGPPAANVTTSTTSSHSGAGPGRTRMSVHTAMSAATMPRINQDRCSGWREVSTPITGPMATVLRTNAMMSTLAVDSERC